MDEVFAAWLWVPSDAEVVELPGGRMVVYPPYVGFRTTVQAVPPPGQEEDVLARTIEEARERGLPDVVWAVPRRAETEAVEALLRRRGAAVDETLDRLAWEIGDVPEAPDGIDVRPVTDEAGARALGRIDHEVFGDPPLSEERLPALVAECRDELESGVGGRYVAWVDGEGVGCGGLTHAGPAVRLWGGATLPGARRRGVYAAVLAERLRVAAERGATLAVVKGRVETSSPLLRRAGFRVVGRETTYRLAL